MQEIFISYSSKDQQYADEIVTYLEERGFSCFIAHRDIKAGESYDMRLIDAIEHAKIVVLVFSDNSDMSKHVKSEIAMAFDNETTIIPYKITGSKPTQLRYYLQTAHWLDATVPTTNHLEDLCSRVSEIVKPSDNKQKAIIAISKLLTDNQFNFTIVDAKDSACYTRITVSLGEIDIRQKRKLMMLEGEAQYKLQAPTLIYRDSKDNLVFEIAHDKTVNYTFNQELDTLHKIQTENYPCQQSDSNADNKFIYPLLSEHQLNNVKVSAEEYQKSHLATMPIILGKNIDGDTVYTTWRHVNNVVVLGCEGSGKRNYIYNLIQTLIAFESPKDVNFAVFGNTDYYNFLVDSPYLAWEMGNYSRAHIVDQLLKIAKTRHEYFENKSHESLYNKNADLNMGDDCPPALVVVLDEVKFDIDELNILIGSITKLSRIYFVISSTYLQLNDKSTVFSKLVVCHAMMHSEDSIDAIGSDAATKLLYASGDIYAISNRAGSKLNMERFVAPYVSDEFLQTTAKQTKDLTRSIHTDNFEQEKQCNMEKLDDLSWKVLYHFTDLNIPISIPQINNIFKCGFNKSGQIHFNLEKLGYIAPNDKEQYFSTVSMDTIFKLLAN